MASLPGAGINVWATQVPNQIIEQKIVYETVSVDIQTHQIMLLTDWHSMQKRCHKHHNHSLDEEETMRNNYVGI